MMEFATDSIKYYLNNIFNKDIKDILIGDLLLVETLTIDGKNDKNERLSISFQELKKFKNLKYLEISNTTINSNVINIIGSLPYLENIVFRNCTFSKQIKSFDKLVNIMSIRIINCSNFDIVYINKLVNIKRIYLSNIKIDTFNNFSRSNIQSLDISNSDLLDTRGIDNLDVNNLIISNKQFEDFKNSFLSLNLKIMVMADKRLGYYIEKWIN